MRVSRKMHTSHTPRTSNLPTSAAINAMAVMVTTDSLRPYERNRMSGYSRDIGGGSMFGIKSATWNGLKMDDCADCHSKHNIPNTCLKCHK